MDAPDVFVEEIPEESVNEQSLDMDSLISQWCSFISNQMEWFMRTVDQTTDMETIELLGSTYFVFGRRYYWIMTSDRLFPG